MDQQLAEFLQATERCTQQLREMLPLEQEKYQALISDDTNQMEEMIQVQQAAIMKLKSLEGQSVGLPGKSRSWRNDL